MAKKLLLQLSVLMIVLVTGSSGATRCYNDLGCFQSGDLHALPQEPSHVRTQFQVSCRNNLNDVIIDALSDEASVKQQIETSCFNVGRQTKLVVHGLNDAASAQWMSQTRDKFLQQYDYNIVLVDWHHGARLPYEQAVANSYMVAKQLFKFIHHLESVQGLDPKRIHLIGHSLGAHIAGNAGAEMTPLSVARVTGLDPAGPYFEGYNDSRRLDASDADYVDVIHSDGETFTGLKGYGSLRPQGDVDIYPNGGQKQPGCVTPTDDDITHQMSFSQKLSCSHARAHDLFIHSIDASACELTAYSCSTWAAYEDGNCTHCSAHDCLSLGYAPKQTSLVGGQYYLSTAGQEPFCGTAFKVTVFLSDIDIHAYGRIMLLVELDNGAMEWVDFSRSNRHYHRRETETHMVTITGRLDQNSKVSVVFDKGSGLSSLGTSDYLYVDKVTVTSFDSHTSWTFCTDQYPGIYYGAWSYGSYQAASCSVQSQ